MSLVASLDYVFAAVGPIERLRTTVKRRKRLNAVGQSNMRHRPLSLPTAEHHRPEVRQSVYECLCMDGGITDLLARGMAIFVHAADAIGDHVPQDDIGSRKTRRIERFPHVLR
ncbi:MAG TPA: hypothetical protein VGF71_02150 [Caulobacteraceae bacterium]